MPTQYINGNKLKTHIKNLLFPVRCPYCGNVILSDEYACKNCIEQFPKSYYKKYAAGGCQCVSPFPYSGIFSRGVKNFKFNRRKNYAKQFAVVMCQCISKNYFDRSFDIVTCVPMHKKMIRKRGYNQAELLARECSKILGVPYCDTLEKFKMNKPQHSVSAKERENNVKGVFRAIDKNCVADKNILIIDDIITTGSTLGECVKVLTKCGCKTICCAALCSVEID